jgi:hypothetical protein
MTRASWCPESVPPWAKALVVLSVWNGYTSEHAEGRDSSHNVTWIGVVEGSVLLGCYSFVRRVALNVAEDHTSSLPVSGIKNNSS